MENIDIKTIALRFKSGFELHLNCEKCVVTRNGLGELTGIRFEGLQNYYPLYYQLSDVECIYQIFDNSSASKE